MALITFPRAVYGQAPSPEVTIVAAPVVRQHTRVTFAAGGDVLIHTWQAPRVEVQASVSTAGQVYGYSNRGDRDAYRAVIADTDSGFVVTAAHRVALRSVGVSTYREKIRHDLRVPVGTRVCIHLLARSDRVEVDHASADSADIEVISSDNVPLFATGKGSRPSGATTSPCGNSHATPPTVTLLP